MSKFIAIDPSFTNTAIVLVDTTATRPLVKAEEFSPKEIVDEKLKVKYPNDSKQELKDKSIEMKNEKMITLLERCINFINKNVDENTEIIIEDLRAFGVFQVYVSGALISSINLLMMKKFNLDLMKDKKVFSYTPSDWQRVFKLSNFTQRDELKKTSIEQANKINNIEILSDDVADAFNMCRFKAKVNKGEFTPFTEKQKVIKREKRLKEAQARKDSNIYVLKYEPNYKNNKKESLAKMVMSASNNLEEVTDNFDVDLAKGETINDLEVIKLLKKEKKEELIKFLISKVNVGYYWTDKNDSKKTFSLKQAFQSPLYKLDKITEELKLDKDFWKKRKVSDEENKEKNER